MIAYLVLTTVLVTFIILYASLLKDYDELLKEAITGSDAHGKTLDEYIATLNKYSELLLKEKARTEVRLNPVLAAVQEKLHKQTEKGLRKYPNSVNPEDYTLNEWLTHIQEEAIDMTVYAEVMKQKMKEES